MCLFDIFQSSKTKIKMFLFWFIEWTRTILTYTANQIFDFFFMDNKKIASVPTKNTRSLSHKQNQKNTHRRHNLSGRRVFVSLKTKQKSFISLKRVLEFEFLWLWARIKCIMGISLQRPPRVRFWIMNRNETLSFFENSWRIQGGQATLRLSHIDFQIDKNKSLNVRFD